jgi:TolA-binding protein
VALSPIADDAKAVAEIEEKQSHSTRELKIVPLFFGKKRVESLERLMKKERSAIAQEEDHLKQLQVELSALQQQKEQLAIASLGDKQSGQQLEHLKLMIKQLNEKRESPSLSNMLNSPRPFSFAPEMI